MDEHFEFYKLGFKELTNKEWDENLSDYLLFLQWKVQEQQLVAQNELCTRLQKLEEKLLE